MKETWTEFMKRMRQINTQYSPLTGSGQPRPEVIEFMTENPPTLVPKPDQDFVDALIEISGVIRKVAKGLGEHEFLTGHDAAKRLYRMGYRRVAEPEWDICSRCLAPNVITAQSICLECLLKRVEK